MYVFTKGHEMEELKELFEKGRILNFIVTDKLAKNKNRNIEKFSDRFPVCMVGYSYDREHIDWEETAKLVKSDVDVIGERLINGMCEAAMKCSIKVSDFNKEEKMEKVVVRSWEELSKNVYIDVASENKILKYLSYKNKRFFFYEDQIKIALDILNALGGNFEYQEVEVIDSYEKWEEFQEKLSENAIFYDRSEKNFISLDTSGINLRGIIKTEEIEKQFNVDLQILKDGE